MKQFLLLISALSLGYANAQIELTKEHFADKDDAARMSSASTSSEIDFGTGEGYFWDFTHLEAQSQKMEVYQPISDLGGFATMQFGNYSPDKYKGSYFMLNPDIPLQFLPSFLPIQFSDYNNVFQLGEDSLSLIGVTISINGQALAIRNDKIESFYYFPVKYGDNYTTHGKFDRDMNPIFDMQWRQKRQHEVNVDGWGKVFTPHGNFECLRIKHSIVEQDSIYASVSGFGTWLPLNIPKQTIYEWRTLDEKVPLVRVKTNTFGNNETITSIEFRDDNLLSINSLEEEMKFSIYPNPVFNVLTIQTTMDFEQYEIMSLDGKIVQSGVFAPAIDCSTLNNGSYILRLTTSDVVQTRTFVKY